nr:LL-diaminopimelate aminotransferase [uncultured Solibaculum sp.]
MATINQHFWNLKESYLFSEIAGRVLSYQKSHPDANIIRMGIGDVTLPLPQAVVEAMHKAVEEMGHSQTFHGYGPEQGYDFLKRAVQDYYAQKGVSLKSDEIFISDGAKSDLGNILDILGQDNTVLVTDPVYPVYVDTNKMSGRSIFYAQANEQNGFLPLPDPKLTADLIYLCSPNNPTGAVYNREQLKTWVDFANQNGSILLFDAAYEAFITEDLPRSIYEIPGAKTCAIEFCSLSKTAGFTGSRCGYTVVPLELIRQETSLNKLWLRRQTTKFNGVPYLVQRGAAAVFSSEGQRQVKDHINYYRHNARMITDTLDELGIWYTGGRNSPYIWLKCPDGMDSWSFFDFLLERAHVVGTPGQGFGSCGEGYFRLTAFSSHEMTQKAMDRFNCVLRKQ